LEAAVSAESSVLTCMLRHVLTFSSVSPVCSILREVVEMDAFPVIRKAKLKGKPSAPQEKTSASQDMDEGVSVSRQQLQLLAIEADSRSHQYDAYDAIGRIFVADGLERMHVTGMGALEVAHGHVIAREEKEEEERDHDEEEEEEGDSKGFDEEEEEKEQQQQLDSGASRQERRHTERRHTENSSSCDSEASGEEGNEWEAFRARVAGRVADKSGGYLYVEAKAYPVNICKDLRIAEEKLRAAKSAREEARQRLQECEVSQEAQLFKLRQKEQLPVVEPQDAGEDVQGMHAPRHLDAELEPLWAEAGRGSKQARMPTLSIRAKVHSKGIHAAIQARLKLLFDTAIDAYVFLDHNASDSITSAELERGFRRLGVDATIRDLGFNYIHIIEFLRLYAWHDIKNIEDLEYAVGASRLNAAKLRAKALERVEALSTAAAAEDNADPSSTSECAEKEEDVMDLMKVMIKLQTELCGKETTYKQVKREVVKLRKKVAAVEGGEGHEGKVLEGRADKNPQHCVSSDSGFCPSRIRRTLYLLGLLGLAQ
jgi:hypothetical protein